MDGTNELGGISISISSIVAEWSQRKKGHCHVSHRIICGWCLSYKSTSCWRKERSTYKKKKEPSSYLRLRWGATWIQNVSLLLQHHSLLLLLRSETRAEKQHHLLLQHHPLLLQHPIILCSCFSELKHEIKPELICSTLLGNLTSFLFTFGSLFTYFLKSFPYFHLTLPYAFLTLANLNHVSSYLFDAPT